MKLTRLFLLSIFPILISSLANGQTIYEMDVYNGSVITTCQGQLWDSDNCVGPEYCSNENYVVTINTGNPALVARLNFLFYNLENGYDGLIFYDGPSTASPTIGTLTGFGATGITTAQSAAVVTSTQQYLTVEFISDGIQNYENISYYGGFQALIGCEMQDCGSSTPAAGDECGSATTICDLNGYCGSTSGWYTAGAESAILGANYGGPFCGSIENNSWVEFTADATSASFTITSSGCDDPASGIQAMIFESDCSTYTPVSNCIEQNTGPGTDVLSASGLTVGNTYYIMIDGFAGNACDYSITANTGVQVVDIGSSAGSNICPGQCTNLTVNATGATSYNWTSSPAGASGSTATINVCPTVTTTYTVEVTGICGGTQTASFTVNAVNPNVDFHALDGSFNSIPMPATVECDDPAFYLEADDSATAGGYITPTLHFIFTSDGFASTDPSLVNLYSGGPPGTGTLIYSKNPLDNNTVLTVYGQYFSPSTDYYIEICDGVGDGGVDYEVVDGNTNVTYGAGSITSGSPCEVFGPFSPAGVASWASTAPAGSWGSNDAGLLIFDPSVAGVGSYDFTYSWDNTLGCSGSATRNIQVIDSQNPTITCPGDINISADAGQCSATPALGSPVSADNCTVVSVTNNAPASFPVGSTNVVWTVTDGGGNTASCTQVVTVTDNENPEISCPSDITVNNNALNCSAVVNYTTPVGTDNCPGAITIQTTGLPSGSAFPVGTTTNTFVVTDGANNTATCSFVVTVNDTEDPIINCPSNITVGNDLGNCSAVVTYNITTSDNCPGVTTTQTAGLSSGSAFPVGTTTNTFLVTDAAGNTATCSFDVTVNDVENSAPTITGDTEYCIGTTATISTQSYVDYLWSNGATTQSTNVTDLDNPITVTVTFANGCVGTSAPYSVTENPNPQISVIPNDPTVCNGTDGYITVNSVSGSTSGDVSWTGTSSGSNNAIVLPNDITNLSAGNYNVTFTDMNGCISNTASAVLTNPGAPIIDLISDTSSCETDYVVPDPVTYITGTNLTGNQAFYSSSGGNAADQITPGTVITSATSPMTIFVYDNSGTCSSEISFVVEVNENPVATISPDPAEVCEGNSLSLNGNPTGGSGTYSTHDWTGNVSILNVTNIQSPSTLTTATSGTYNLTYTVTDDKGCSGSDNITVEINETPVLSGNQEICEDETTTISSTGTPDASTPWTSANTSVATVDASGNVLGISGGTVDITFLDANGCSAIISVVVNAKPVITLTPNDPTTCNGTDGFITVNGTGSGTVDWSGDAMGTDGSASLPYDISNLAAGNYDVSFTDPLTGCVSDQVSTSLNNPGAPIIDAINDTSSCEVDFVIPDPSTAITGTNLTGNQAFYSSPGGNPADELTPGTIITSAMSPMTVYAYDNNGVCQSEISFVVYVNENPTVSISPNPISVCTDESIPVNGNPAGGSGNYLSHNWTNSGVVNLDDQTIQVPNFSSSTSGNFDLTYTVEDDNGCSATETVAVTVLQSTVIDAMPLLEACGEITLPTITGSNLSGSEAFYDDTQANGGQIVSGNITSSDIYYIFDSGANCSNEVTVEITIHENPEITSVLGDLEYCDYEMPQDIIISVSGQADWNIGYTLDGINQTVTSSQNNINLGNTPGVYNITLIEDNLCSDTINEVFELIIKPSPSSPQVNENAEYCSNDQMDTMRAEGSGGTITWYINQFQQIYGSGEYAMPENITGSTVYYITETINGCESEPSEISINVIECDITLPTAITPDGDGLNDTWEIPKLDASYPDNVVRVYNRWGGLIFEHDSSKKGPYNNNPWDGTIGGKVLPVGSYYFVIDLNNEAKETKNGAISIILD